MKLKILNESYKVVKLDINSSVPVDFFDKEFYSFTKTEDEISIVISSNSNIESDYIEKDFKIIKLEGILDFSLIGILSKISKILADNNISIFVTSTYNTDYILVKKEHIETAKQVLTENNYYFD